MKSSTYKWIIGCLSGIIIILVAFLVVKEEHIVSVSFSECLSVSATLSSLILSVVAMLYTYYSGRDTITISNQIQNTIKEVDKQVQQISGETKKNSEILTKITDALHYVEGAVNTSSKALATIQQKTLSEQEKQSAIADIEQTKNTMIMFLNKMRQSD